MAPPRCGRRRTPRAWRRHLPLAAATSEDGDIDNGLEQRRAWIPHAVDRCEPGRAMSMKN
jgi:hypothetical protein